MLNGFRGLTLFLAVLGFPLASYFLVFKPQNIEIEKRRENVEHKEALLKKLQTESARTADLVQATEQVTNTLRVIESRLPSNQEIDLVIRKVSELATDAGLEPPAMKSGKPTKTAFYMELPLEMEVQGDWIGFRTFLAELEKLPRLKRIPDIKITTQTKEDQKQIKAEFKLCIYFQDDARRAALAE